MENIWVWLASWMGIGIYIVVSIFALILAVLSILLPWFVYQIKKRASRACELLVDIKVLLELENERNEKNGDGFKDSKFSDLDLSF